MIDQHNTLHIFINNSRINWPTEILMQILSFVDKLLLDACIILKSVDNFEIAHKTSILVWGAVSL